MDSQRLRKKIKFYYDNQNLIKIKYGSALIKGKISKPVRPFIGSFFIFDLTDGNSMRIYLDELENYDLMPVSDQIEIEVEEEVMKIRKNRNSIPKAVKKSLWENHFSYRYRGKCFCCKNHIEKDDYEVGHYISVANGGDNSLGNLRPLCFSCNRSMGSDNMEDFIIEFFA